MTNQLLKRVPTIILFNLLEFTEIIPKDLLLLESHLFLEPNRELEEQQENQPSSITIWNRQLSIIMKLEVG